jgi:hypothetical protein
MAIPAQVYCRPCAAKKLRTWNAANKGRPYHSESKRCAQCKATKAIGEFPKVNKSYCRECANARAREWGARNKDRIAIGNRKAALRPYTKETARCSRCKESKPVSEFHMKIRPHAYCKSCAVLNGEEWRRNNPEKKEQYNLEYKTRQRGTTPEWFMETLANQDGVCGICKHPETDRYKKTGRAKSLAIDHDHQTGKVRGLLCTKCNQSLFLLEKHKGWAENAVRYLSAFNSSTNERS